MGIETISADYLLSSEFCITFPGTFTIIFLLNSINLIEN